MLSLQETPVKNLEGIFYKEEYTNPSGSVKDRGLPHQIEEAVKKGYKKFVLSSSGNAAISASYWSKKKGLELTVFVSPKINKGKLKKLQNDGANVILSKKPISDATKFSKQENVFNLRASTDPNGFVGYKSIASELVKQIGKIGTIFIPVSSGTLCYGVAKGFEDTNNTPQIHVVQTTYCNIISSSFDNNFQKTDLSLADALVAKTSSLKSPLIKMIKKSGGFGWVVDDESMKSAWNYLEKNGIITSYEGAATLAALRKAKSKGFKPEEPVVCLLTGKYYT